MHAIEEMRAVAINCEICRFHAGTWLSESDTEITDSQQLRYLGKVRDEKSEYFRPRKQKTAFFWVDALTAAVVVTCNSAIKATRLAKLSKGLARCYADARNEFDATHDGLTLLPNRPAFEKAAAESVTRLLDEGLSTEGPSVSTSRDGVTLLALDLDYFKQINDDFGHPYGDVVLAAFAWRLEQFAEDFEKTSGLKTYVARLGGEEFHLLIEGLPDQNEGLRVADSFRQRLAAALPSEDEWLKITARRGVAPDRLPPESERRLTVSIGHAMLTAAEARATLAAGSSHARNVLSALISQADIALYRAKADGRDCARSFRDIRDRLGRVLEHHPDTSIVTVDIGTEVGAKEGMEFLVYHPHFFGQHPYYQSDGRSRKRLGTYPKYASGRIQIFSSSREISFAHVIENKQDSMFQQGSRLEYVPLGSITHLVSPPLGGANETLSTFDHVLGIIKQAAGSRRRIFVITLAIQDLDRIVVAGGTARGNDILASLFQDIRATFGRNAVVTMASATQFVVLPEFGAGDSADVIVMKKIHGLCENSSRGGKCIAGVFDSKKVPLVKEKPEMAVECARIALSIAESVEIFTEDTASQVIYNWRSKRAWDEGIADYKRFKAYGLNASSLENAAGLCFLDRRPPDYKGAIVCFLAANELAANEENAHTHIYELNLAYTYAYSGEHVRAVELFRKHPIRHEKGKPEPMAPVYLVAYARALVLLQNQTELNPLEVLSVIDEVRGRAGDLVSGDWQASFDRLRTSLLGREGSH